MYRARIVFNGSLSNEYPFYSIAKATEEEVREMLRDMESVLRNAVSVQLQESTDQGVGWVIIPVFNL